jgi:steroid delta-isomerase-like uncharacterized protein
MNDGTEFVRQADEAWNSHDVERWVALAADDIVVAASGGFSGRGPDGYRLFAQTWQGAFSDCRVTIRNIAAEGDRVMSESTFEGTHDGPLSTPAGDVIPPTGKRVSVEYVDAWQIRGGKAIYERVYFDELELLAQLGV